MALAKGTPAPDFKLKANDDKEYRLSDYRGKKVVLVFYPFDFSSFCSQHHACMMNDLAKFNEAGAQVFGLSVDSIWAHKAFAEKVGIRYPLLADFHPKGEVGRLYGVYVDGAGFNGRTTFIVGPDGNIAEVIESAVPSVPQAEPVLAALGKAK
jgi:peroxiredoxin (alkyl hydroperoxide reductase subunit C)